MPQIPTWAQAVPQAHSCSDTNDLGDKWKRHNFIYLVVVGLKRAKVKPLNYSQVTTVQKGLDESPCAFLRYFKDAIQRHTTVDPEPQMGEVLLKDKFELNWHLTSIENFKEW
jgi:hypothetical protein